MSSRDPGRRLRAGVSPGVDLAWTGAAAALIVGVAGATGATGGASATAPMAWKNAARADAAVFVGRATGSDEGGFGRIGVMASAFGKQG